MSFIKSKEFEKVLLKVEDVFKSNGLDVFEQEIVITALKERILQQRSRVASREMMDSMPFGNIIKKLQKKKDDKWDKLHCGFIGWHNICMLPNSSLPLYSICDPRWIKCNYFGL